MDPLDLVSNAVINAGSPLLVYKDRSTNITFKTFYIKFGDSMNICLQEPSSAVGWDANCTYKLKVANIYSSVNPISKPIGKLLLNLI